MKNEMKEIVTPADCARYMVMILNIRYGVVEKEWQTAMEQNDEKTAIAKQAVIKEIRMLTQFITSMGDCMEAISMNK